MVRAPIRGIAEPMESMVSADKAVSEKMES
jgi:hypothetical protein